MIPRILRSHPWRVGCAAVLLTFLGALALFAQTDMTGYWAFRVADGGVNFFQFQQTGDAVASVASAGRGGRGGTLNGTFKGGKLHLASTVNPPAPTAAPAAGRGAAAAVSPRGPRIMPPTWSKAPAKTPVPNRTKRTPVRTWPPSNAARTMRNSL